MENKYCRICWNTAGWRLPTGDAVRIETGQSYVAKHGFGHEEWIFNYEWLFNGYRYGYLQPIGKYRERYQGDSCSILLYTFTPEGQALLIAELHEVFIPTDDELAQVHDFACANGWIDEMRREVGAVEGNVRVLDDPTPAAITNVRFHPANVEMFDPRPRMVGTHTIVRNRRYHPFNWYDHDHPVTELWFPRGDVAAEPIDPTRSEDIRTRAAQRETTITPRHVRLQNRLYEYLCNEYGPENVGYEDGFVDLTATTPGCRTFFEIKIEQSARRCIRSAMGQLLEYAHYAERNRAERLVVVGDMPASDDDRAYMYFLRHRYNLELYYSRFSWETGELTAEV